MVAQRRHNSKRPLIKEADDLMAVITAIHAGEPVLLDLATRTCLQAYGVDPLMRLLIDQSLQGTGINTTALWAYLDRMEDISPLFGWSQAAAIVEAENTERLVDRLLPCRGFSILASKPKVGKSTLARNLIASVVSGEPFLGRSVRKGLVLYYVLEESMSEVFTHLQALKVQGEGTVMFRRGRVLPANFLRMLKADVAQVKPALVLLDPLIDILGLGDVDSNGYSQVNHAVKPLVNELRYLDTHCMALHHINKLSGKLTLDSLLGSTSFAASADAILLMGEKADGTRTFRSVRRYLHDREIALTDLDFDEDTGATWLAAPEPPAHGDLMEEMLTILKKIGRARSGNDLMRRVPGNRQVMLDLIKAATADGRMIRHSDNSLTLPGVPARTNGTGSPV